MTNKWLLGAALLVTAQFGCGFRESPDLKSA